MRYAIFSDVHSNLEAFGRVCDYYLNKKIDKYIFLGDIVGYAANPTECIKCLKNLNPICVLGNHDAAAINKLSTDYFNDYAKEAIFWTKKELSPEDNNYLGSFALTYEERDFVCVHGSLDNLQRFNYILGINDATHNFSLLTKKLLFVGHSHRMEAYSYIDGEVSYASEDRIKIMPDSRYIINAGSVGQPRDRDSRTCACIYDSDEKVVLFERLEYNIQKAADKILVKGLPTMLAQRLFAGI